MFLNSDANIINLIQKVKLCKGDVHLITEEGDNLNLKSQLCQFAAVALVAKPEILIRAKIVCDDKSDEDLLKEYIHE